MLESNEEVFMRLVVNNKYLIFKDKCGVVAYNLNGGDLPQYVLRLCDKLRG